MVDSSILPLFIGCFTMTISIQAYTALIKWADFKWYINILIAIVCLVIYFAALIGLTNWLF